MKNIKLLAIAGVVGVLAGCAQLPITTDGYRKVDLPAGSGTAPTPEQLQAQMKSKGQKIVVTPFDVADRATQHRYTTQAYDELTQQLMDSGNTILDRKLASKLKPELVAAEKKGIYDGSGPHIADIAMMPRLVTLNSNGQFVERRVYKDKKGNVIVIPAKCQYSGDASMSIRAYRIPSMELINTYTFNGRVSRSTETRYSNCAPNTSLKRSLESGAVKDAILRGVKVTLNDITPPAYIIGRRDKIDGDDSLFRTTMNKIQGARAKLKVNIYRIEKNYNEYTQQTRTEKVLIGSGVMTSMIDDTGSYVDVTDKKLIQKITFGDVIQLDHGKCLNGEFEILGHCMSLSSLLAQ
ncbi:hypothetical protein [Celerinatantimonas sp. YJH-8]|uniref:hypothetical protein n=1 Tax=Celerinatantimonas sp. YJH-8 TaxID=3228714 RepID=UPI0038C398A5